LPVDSREGVRPQEVLRYGAFVLFGAIAVELAVESRRAVAALGAWICRTSPTPAGPQACENAFILRWMTGHLPLYVLATGIVAILASAASLAVRTARSGLGGSFPWDRLLRAGAIVVGLIALAELVACAGDATCGLSVNCT
jgi:hypothetical protein